MPEAPIQDRKTGLDYPVSIFYMYVTPDEAFEVYAVSIEDAYESLFENEPKLVLDDITMVKEHKCPTKNEIVH